VQRYSLVIVEEAAIVRDCKGIERMGVMYVDGIIDYLVSGLGRGHGDSGKKEGQRKKRR
jgi:hypothetical protein